MKRHAKTDKKQCMTSPTPVNTPRAATSEIQTCTLGSSYDPPTLRAQPWAPSCAPTFLLLGENPWQPNRKPIWPIWRKTSSAGWNNLRMTVLTVDHNEIDEGNNLTDVGHSATNVNSAKRLRDALEHCNGRTEGARLALVHLGKSLDTNVNPGPWSGSFHTPTRREYVRRHNILWRVLRS